MCSLDVLKYATAPLTFGTSILAGDAIESMNQPGALTNANGDQLSDVDQSALDRVQDPSKKAEMLMNWLIGPKPKPVNPGEDFAKSEKMAGVIARADAGRGMSGLFGLGLLVGDTAPNLNLPVGQPGQEPAATPIADLTPQVPKGSPTYQGGNTGQPGTGPMGPTQSVPNRGPGDVYPIIGGKK